MKIRTYESIAIGDRASLVRTITESDVIDFARIQYAMGKNALEIITRQIATEYGPFGITANCVAPGMTNTGFIADISERARALEAQNTPTRRLTRVDDVSELICFLASEKAGQINGQTLHVSGGALM